MSNAPKVTVEMINDLILSEHYFTAAEGVGGSYAKLAQRYPDPDVVHPAMDLLTFCVIVLKNGFTVTGESACLSPDNFNVQTGRDVARANAIDKIWMLEGYRIKSELHQETGQV